MALASLQLARPSIRETLDRRYWLTALVAGAAAFLGLGLLSAIIPNPVFGRTIPPDASAIAVWLASAPLVGLLAATYVAPTGSIRVSAEGWGENGGTSAFTVGGLATFFAIGCPVCNKLVLLALGTGGALTVFAPIQPLIGLASLALLAGTLAWRLRRRASGCALPASGQSSRGAGAP